MSKNDKTYVKEKITVNMMVCELNKEFHITENAVSKIKFHLGIKGTCDFKQWLEIQSVARWIYQIFGETTPTCIEIFFARKGGIFHD